MGKLKFHRDGWDSLVREVVDNEAVPRMRRVADACNGHLDRPGYLVSVEGDDQLRKRSYRATVITATGDAMRDNQKHNRLVGEFHQAGGA